MTERPSPADYEQALAAIEEAIRSAATDENAVAPAMTCIAEHFPRYAWVGVYWLFGDTLLLGPYVGEETDHTRIPVGRGVCGQAVAEGKNQLVGDVRTLSNYLACSVKTRSEIVVLIRDEAGRILGQIDADGHAVDDFDHADEAFLTRVAALLAPLYPKEVSR